MASIRENAPKSGGKTWSVLYRLGTKQPSTTFSTLEAAEEFKELVNLLGPDRALRIVAGEPVRGLTGTEFAKVATLLGPDRAMQAMTGNEQPRGITVAQLWERFIEWKDDDLTPRTRKDYRRDYGNYIEPWFGHMVADDVDEGDVQKWVDHMRKTLGSKTVADRHMILHSMYEFGRARSRRLVEHNPCKETALPKRGKRKQPKGTTTVEFRAILAAAEKRNPDARDLILYLGETGWRFSEGTALDVREVEDDGIDVWVNMGQVTRIDESGRQYIAEDEAKSAAGFRRIRMFPDTAAMLRRRVIGRAPGDLVFTNSRGRQWNQNTFLRETWPKIIEDAGVITPMRKPTPHWLRHMHGAVLSAAKVPMQEIQRRIGHEHYSTTVDVYGRMIGDIDDDAMARAAALMSGKAAAPSIAPTVEGEVVEVIVGELE